MDVVVERCAGLDVHRDTVVATVRTPAGTGRRRHQVTRTYATTQAPAGRAARVAHRARRDVGRDGSDRRLLEAGLLRVGGPLRVLVVERPASPQRAGPQDRRGRLGVDLPDGRARTGAPELRATTGDPSAARPDPAAQGADRRADPSRSAVGEGDARRRDQADQRRRAGLLEVGASDVGGAARRGDRPERAGRVGQGTDAFEDPAAARSARQPVPG